MMDCRDPAVLIDGPVYTGKTMAVLYKGLVFADRYPRSRVLLARKTRKSLTESVLVTFEEKILPSDSGIVMHGGDRERRTYYELPNGSVIVCGGMDPGASVNNRASIMSTEWDLILLFESTEFTEDEIQKLRTRLRNGKAPYQQIIMDCNPGAPTHHLIQAANAGHYTRCPSRHRDNPRLWNHAAQDWTDEGRRYMAVLENLTGHRRARLRDGMWAAAEGGVYPEFDATVHVINPFHVPPTWRRIRAIDFGFTNPFVCQWWAIDGDGRMYLYRELYRSKVIVSDHAERIKALSAGETYEATVADHDAEDRATLARAGIDTTPAQKDISPGVQAVSDRLRPAADRKPRIFFMRDALVERDQVMADAKKPCATVEEFDGYIWRPSPDGKPVKEDPVKVDDHGMDTMRYAVRYIDGGPQVFGRWSMEAAPVQTKEPAMAFAEARQDPDFGFEE
jgi:PBSX family phage terminase large subunit